MQLDIKVTCSQCRRLVVCTMLDTSFSLEDYELLRDRINMRAEEHRQSGKCSYYKTAPVGAKRGPP